MTSENEDLYVGIDLGTSRSSIITSENQQYVVDSYVGWPVDMVARKVLKQSVLIGRKAIDNRTMLDLHRPLEWGLIKDGSEKDQLAVRELLSHLMNLAGVEEARNNGKIVRAVVGVPAEALRVNKQHLRQAMKGLVDNLIIVSEPFSVAYGLEALLHSMVVDIGAGTTDFCVVNGRYPTEDEQRTLPNAGDWLDEQLRKLIQERHPGVRASIHTIRAWKEKWAFVGIAKNPVKVTVPIDGRPQEIDLTEEMRQVCENLVPPVAETMVDLISNVDIDYQEKVRHNIILAGGCSGIKGLTKQLEQALFNLGGGKVQVVADPVFAGCKGGLSLAKDALRTDWDKLPA